MIQLDDEYIINRYSVMNAATGNYKSEFNTKAFKIEASTDGIQWQVIDKVSENKSNIVDKFVNSFNAEYVRIYIDDPGEDGIARIQEFELYGTRVNL